MSTQNQPQPAEPPKHAEQGVAVELSAEALHNLTGYFDVLIQMDFAQKQRNKLRSQKNDRIRDPRNTNASSS